MQTPNERMLEAVNNGSAQDVGRALAEGAEVNFKFPVEYLTCTALGFALSRGDVSIVQCLLRWGADCEIQNLVPGRNNTRICANALVQTIETRQAFLFYILIHGGANYYARDYLYDLQLAGSSDEIKGMTSSLAIQLASDGMRSLKEYHDPDVRIPKMHMFNKRRAEMFPAKGAAQTAFFSIEAPTAPQSTAAQPAAEGAARSIPTLL